MLNHDYSNEKYQKKRLKLLSPKAEIEIDYAGFFETMSAITPV